MTTEVKVKTAEIVLRTVKLTKALLKQFKKADGYYAHKIGAAANGKFIKEKCVGWIHGSVMGDEFSGPWVIFPDGEGTYCIYNVGMDSAVKDLPQIYVV